MEEDTIEATYFESNQLDMFLDAVVKIGLELDREWFFTLAFSGMHSGELISLKKSNLDFKENTIRISKTMYNPNNNMKKYELITTKTNVARTINMDERIMNMLKRLVVRNDMHKLKYKTQIEDFHDKDFVSQRKNGYPFITKTIANRMKRLMKYINLEKNLTPHSFRHTYISTATEAGNSLPTIMQKVGHEDPNTTLRIYTHVTEKMKIKSIENTDFVHGHLLEKLNF